MSDSSTAGTGKKDATEPTPPLSSASRSTKEISPTVASAPTPGASIGSSNPAPGLAAVNTAGSVRRHPLGGVKEKMIMASAIPKIDFAKVLTDLPGNPFVYQRRVAQNLLAANEKVLATQSLTNQFAGKLETSVNSTTQSTTQDKTAANVTDVTKKEGSQ